MSSPHATLQLERKIYRVTFNSLAIFQGVKVLMIIDNFHYFPPTNVKSGCMLVSNASTAVRILMILGIRVDHNLD